LCGQNFDILFTIRVALCSITCIEAKGSNSKIAELCQDADEAWESRRLNMKKLLAMLLIATCGIAAHAADDQQKLDGRLDAARNVIDSIMSVPDKAVPDGIARHAKCIAVVPGVVKGAFIVGAEYGQGVVTCRTARGWSAPVFIRLAGGSFGFR